MENKEDFSLESSRTSPAFTDGFTADDFKFVQQDKSIHDQRFQGRSTTYLKDIVRRFVKNKTSVFGFCLFGLLVVLAMGFTFFLPGNANKNAPTVGERYLPPKLFKAGTGFWDGTRKYTGLLYNPSTGEPVIDNIDKKAIMMETLTTYDGTYDSETPYGKGGLVQVDAGNFIGSPNLSFTVDQVAGTATPDDASDDTYAFAGDYSLSFTGLTAADSSAAASISIYYRPIDASGSERVDVPLVSGYAITSTDVTIDLTSYLKQNVPADQVLPNGRIIIKTDGESGVLFKTVALNSTGADWSAFTIDDASSDLMITKNNETGKSSEETANWWVRSNSQSVHAAQVAVTYCNFTYDPYEAVYGIKSSYRITSDVLSTLKDDGIITYELTDVDGVQALDVSTLKVLNQAKNYIIVGDADHPITVNVTPANDFLGIPAIWNIDCSVYMYKTPTYGYSSIPVHVFGTDTNGFDMLKLVSKGMLLSLLIGVVVSAICFAIGLAWGSFSGYQGGLIDLGMERIVDILSYIPGMVLITLFILNWGHKFWVFMLAMCFTGWIGTAGLTRTQFYRFKRREYVLASRSLGASDARLIYRHILPNGLGTIITASVLMIPSVIYSEASLAYLGLGLTDITSLGTIIQNNQNMISTVGQNPDLTYLILFPSLVLALLLICFEMFGQGLRDAVNPNTKGIDD